jgi:hypothetical protein
MTSHFGLRPQLPGRGTSEVLTLWIISIVCYARDQEEARFAFCCIEQSSLRLSVGFQSLPQGYVQVLG